VDGDLLNRADATQLDEQVCIALVAYLTENPRAMDTLEGIVNWWLPRQQIRFDVRRVSRALETLRARGIVEVLGAGSTQWYRLKASPEGQAVATPNIEQSRG
jgi:hypothetical protein